MARRTILDQKGINFLTITVSGWMDLFSRLELRNIVLTNLDYCRKQKELRIYAYVIMTNHIHLIVQISPESTVPLGTVIGDFKRYTGHLIVDHISTTNESRKEWIQHLLTYFARGSQSNRANQIWQADNYPTALYTDKVIWEKIHYIHQNPVRAGIVEHPHEYLYSSASNYTDGLNKGLIEIDLMDPYLPNSGHFFIPDEHRPI